MRKLIFFLLAFVSISAHGQVEMEKILYVVDSIPIFENLDAAEANLSENLIASINVVTNKADFGYYKIFDFNKLIFIFTKEYAKRPDNIKKIPSFKKMYEREGKWCLVGLSSPYTGPVIDYYYTGIKKRDGFLANGVDDGLANTYYKDGKIKFSVNYNKGVENGESVHYFTNGQVKQKGSYKNGKEDGIWQEWYSTGIFKQSTEFKSGKARPTKDDLKFYSLLENGSESFGKRKFNEAVIYYNKAAELNPNNSDLYFHRGRAYFFNHNFDEAIADFDKVVEIEPLYMEAYSHRAFTRIRKYELKDSRTLSENNEITVLATKGKVEIPLIEKEKICYDLKKGVELGDTMKLIVDAIKKYCE
jgi:Uncharacterized protein conserved in bacteria